MRRAIGAAAFAAILLAGIATGMPRAGYAYSCLLTNGNCVKWPDASAHLKLLLGAAPQPLSNGTVTYDENAILAAETWNGIGSFQFSWEVGGNLINPCGSGAGHVCDNTGPAGDNPVFLTATVCGRGFGDVLAQTTSCFETRTGRLVNSPVFFDANQTWDAYDGSLRFPYDIRRVLTHELGHVLGLQHPDDNGQSVRALMNRRISDVDRPQSDDVAGGLSLYGGGSPPVTAQPNGGCAIGDTTTHGGWLFGIVLAAAAAAWRRRRPR